MADKINEDVLDQLLVEVTDEIAGYLRKDEAALRKAVGDEGPPAPDEESEGSEGPSAPAASAGPPDEGSAPPEASAPAPDAAMAPEASAPDAGMAPQGDQQAIEPAPSVEALMGEYQKLDPEALKMHYLACKQALMMTMGAGPEASAPQGPPPGPQGAPAPAPAPEASAPPMQMGEMSAGKSIDLSDGANGGEVKGGKLGKSEKDIEIEMLKAKLAKNDEQILELAMKLTAPIRKSVKGLSDLAFIAKEGAGATSPVASLSKSEIIAKLREKSRDGSLKKSDREKINDFTLGAAGVTVKDIEHLLA